MLHRCPEDGPVLRAQRKPLGQVGRDFEHRPVRKAANGRITNVIERSVNVVRHVNATVFIHRRLRTLADGIASDVDAFPCTTRVGHVEDVVIDHVRIDHVWVVAVIEHDVDVIHTPAARAVRIKRGLDP